VIQVNTSETTVAGRQKATLWYQAAKLEAPIFVILCIYNPICDYTFPALHCCSSKNQTDRVVAITQKFPNRKVGKRTAYKK